MYLNDVRFYLHELKAHDVDLLGEATAGHSLISIVVSNKLPVALERKLVLRLFNNYPTISDVFSNYNAAVRALNNTGTSVSFQINTYNQ